VQWTSTTEGLRNLPLIGGLCLAQQTLTINVSKNCKQASGKNYASHCQNGMGRPQR
jgi:hypothetical protein